MKMETDVGFIKKVEKEKDRIIDQKHQLIFLHLTVLVTRNHT